MVKMDLKYLFQVYKEGFYVKENVQFTNQDSSIK